MLRQFGLLLDRRRRRDLPEQHHRARSRSSASASTSRRRRATTSARARSAGSSSGSARSRRGPRSRSRSRASSSSPAGLAVEGKLVLQTDPIQWVNQKSQVIKDLHVLDTETGSSSELGVFVQSKNTFDDKTVTFVDDFTRSQLAKYPEHAAHRLEHRRERQRPHATCPARPTSRRPAPRCRPRTTSRPRDIQLSTVAPRRAEPHLPHRPERARRARRRRPRDPRRPCTRRRGVRRDAVGSRGRRRRPARQPRGEPGPAHLPRDPLRVPVPHGPAAQHRPRAAVARAGADRRRRRVAVRVRPAPEAEPDDRGRRPARRRGVHRVHVADPACASSRNGAGALRRATRSTSPRRAPAARSSSRR